MQYSARVYLKNKRKWETLNKLIDEINDTMGETDRISEEMGAFKQRMLHGIVWRTTPTGATYDGRTVVISKRGIGIGTNNYKGGLRYGYGVELDKYTSYLKANKRELEAILKAIKRPDKRGILELFVKNAATYPNAGATIKFTQKTNKRTIFTDRNDMREIAVTEIVAEIDFTSNKISIYCTYADDEHARNYDLDGDGTDANMTKEQLYLPIWKLLIKVKRHANKHRRTVGREFATIKKATEPYWVADRIGEARA
jgi:hypothetical protein